MRWIFTFLIFFSCSENNTPQMSSIDTYSFKSESRKTIKLSKKLQELSGLAFTNDGRLFGHNDEKALICEIDLKNGDINKTFSIGKKTLREDFEGLAIVEKYFYLVNSNGTIFEFEEGEDGSHVSYEKYKTKLSVKSDVEGLCYDPETNALLLACKGDAGKGYSGYRSVYSFSLSKKKLNKKPRFLIPIKKIKKERASISEKLGDFFLLTEGTFAPSGIERHPGTGSFYILASQGRVIVEISSHGDILGLAFLDKKHHKQPEGIAFTQDHSLLIGDEGAGGRAIISTYSISKDN